MIPSKSSAAFVYQMEQVLEVYEKPYDADFPVVCMDESPKQIIDYKEIRTSKGNRLQDSEYVRLGVAELFVAFEPLAGHRAMTIEDDHTTTTWVHFMASQMDAQYKEAKKVTWVMDNFVTHKPENFYKVFPPAQAKAYLDRMDFVYTPKHGSWLNMAEIQFALVGRDALDKPFKNKKEVESAVKSWELAQNQLRRGANWQFTTEKARIKLKKLYPTI
ncbi:MAG: IS630 family transposase [Haliscomenobacter sp.]|uniref:IS630 family transposase n=1 Tax=Haliscomenobacter sp. TaxID=2717303 RepID=UPI0029B0BF31|nr:IS630 family transposase [Haliscomenobacter sp.]MDX2071721.1 IS630 family transposase [Haliscomenobacter sp.]